MTEIDFESYRRALEHVEKEELREGARFPGGKGFPVVHQYIDLGPDEPPAAQAQFYAVNDRPVKLVPTDDGGLDVQVLNMRTGQFERDMSYLSRCLGGEGDVDTFGSEAEFDEYVTEVRAGLTGGKRHDGG
jgi:hypothetical protein